MQEKNSNQRNISKKRSENVKYPPRIHEKIKYMNNLIASPKYNNNSINNSLLLNKSVEKFDQKQNPRNISQSTKYMKTKEKAKITQINKSKNRYGKTKEKDIEYNSKLYNNKKDDENNVKSKDEKLNININNQTSSNANKKNNVDLVKFLKETYAELKDIPDERVKEVLENNQGDVSKSLIELMLRGSTNNIFNKY